MSGNVILDKTFCYLSINKVVFAEGNTDSVLKLFLGLQTYIIAETTVRIPLHKLMT